MKRFNIFATLAGAVMLLPAVSHGAYPVYSAYQSNATYARPQAQPQAVYQATNAQGQVVYLPATGNTVIAANSGVAASPTRVTGALPRVGSNVVSAGRQYYQPADYDRLADSGLYIGVSVGYTASVMGNISADYTGEKDAFFVPGAFESAKFKSDSVIPLQLSVGAAINNDIRVDFSFLRYSGISYPSIVNSSNGAGGYVEAAVDGGAITNNATMLNVYYNIDSFTGYLAGGSLRPYIGAGVGISLNTIADYVVYDNTFYAEVDYPLDIPTAGILTGVSDVYAYHNGGTEEQLAFMLEGGLTTDLDGGLKLDMFVRYSNLGRVKTSGSIIVSQTEWLSTGGVGTGEEPAPYDSVFHYTNWYESGRIGMVDVGARLRLQF
ncbi:MAG: hypothetical protein NC311_00425 [Muribaculaceae bacterium]|nr:hypothetical protein [Muribaculaceae bacterium]